MRFWLNAIPSPQEGSAFGAVIIFPAELAIDVAGAFGTALRALPLIGIAAASGHGFKLFVIELNALFLGEFQYLFLVFAGFDLGDLFPGQPLQ